MTETSPASDDPHHVRIIVEGPNRECLGWDDVYSWAEARRLLRALQDCYGKLVGEPRDEMRTSLRVPLQSTRGMGR